MHFNTKEFNSKAHTVIREAKEQEVKSPVWIWMACGAFAGLVASCIKLHKPTIEPIVGTYRKEEDGTT